MGEHPPDASISMADKVNTWLNGAGVVTHSRPDSVPTSAPSRANLTRTLLISGALVLCSALALQMTPDEWMWESLRVMAVAFVLLASFYLPLGRAKPAFVIWFVLLISECIFFREGDLLSNTNAYAGQFPTAAYGEAVGWFLCFIAALACSARVRGYLRQLFEGDYKWVTLFVVICVGSCAYTPRVSLGLVWSFKLLLVSLLILVCSIRIHDLRDTTSFLRFTVWAYLIIVLQPVIIAALRGEMFDEEGRMSTIV